jgi:tetratricopeptide (TPR) repeat protein
VAKEDYDAAIEQYEKAVGLKPDDATIHYNLGTVYLKKEDYESAVAEYKKAIEIEPKMGDAHNGLAFGYYSLKEYDSAWAHIEVAEELGIDLDKELVAEVKKRLR